MSEPELTTGQQRFVYVSMVVMAVGFVIPWVCYITPADYFRYMYPTKNIEFYLPVVNMLTLFVGTVFMTSHGQQYRLDTRIICSITALFFCMWTVPILNVLFERGIVTADDCFYLTLLSVFCLACFNSVLQSSLYSLAGVFGGFFTQALETGKGYAACFIVALRMITKATSDTAPKALVQSVNIFFGIGIMIILAALIMFLILLRMEFTQYHLNQLYDKSKRLLDSEVKYNSIDDSEKGVYVVKAATVHSGTLHKKDTKDRTLHKKEKNGNTETDPLISRYPKSEPVPSHIPEVPSAFSVFKKVKKEAIGVFSIFTVCLSCFPGMTTTIVSTTFALGDWFPLILIATYNICDLIGKSAPLYYMPITHEMLHIPVIIDLCFVPLFILNLHPQVFPAIMLNDFFPIILVACLGLTTGYIGTCSMILGPKQVGKSEKELAGAVDVMFLIGGLCFGSILGLVISMFLL